MVDFPLLSSTFVENSLACGASFLLAFCLIFAWDFIRHHKATILGYFLDLLHCCFFFQFQHVLGAGKHFLLVFSSLLYPRHQLGPTSLSF